MAALAQDRNTPKRENAQYARPVAANAKIFAGALVCMSATGWATPGAVATTLKVDGRALAPADNTGGANGAINVTVEKGTFRFGNSSAGDLITAADIGNTAYIVDDQTVAKTNGGATRSAAGTIQDVDAQGVWVRIT